MQILTLNYGILTLNWYNEFRTKKEISLFFRLKVEIDLNLIFKAIKQYLSYEVFVQAEMCVCSYKLYVFSKNKSKSSSN